MSDACEFDGGDCETCGEQCNKIYNWAWTLLAGNGVYQVNHTTACGSFWDKAVNYLDQEPMVNCTDLVESADYNGDFHLNIREFQFVAGVFFHGEINEAMWLNLNCSACMGMEYYNPKYDG